MFKHRVAPLLALLLVFFAQSTQAFFDPPLITPPDPKAGQTISMNMRGGGCDAIVGWPGYPQISQQGNVITMLFFGVRETDPVACNFGEGIYIFPVGEFPAGSYVLNVNLRYMGFSGLSVVDQIGTVAFTVSPAATAPVAADALSAWSLMILVFAILGASVCMLFRGKPTATLALILVRIRGQSALSATAVRTLRVSPRENRL